MRLGTCLIIAGLGVLTAGCPQSINTLDDGGTVPLDLGPTRDAGDADATISRDGGTPDAQADADAGQADGDVPDAGVRPPLSWREMNVNATSGVSAIWGRSPSEVYAGTSNGKVLAYDGAGTWTQAWSVPTNHGVDGIGGTATRIFVIAETSLYVHGPDLGEDYSSHLIGTDLSDLFVVSDTEAYVLAVRMQTDRGLYRWDGTTVTVVRPSFPVASLTAVWSAGDGTLVVAGNGKIFSFDGVGWAEDVVDWPAGWTPTDQLYFYFRELQEVNGALHAFGDNHTIYRRDPGDGVWRRVYEPVGDMPLEAVVSTSLPGQVEAWAFGRRSTGGPIVRFFQGAWTSAGYPANHNLVDAWAAGPDEVFAVGWVANTVQPLIIRGTR